LRGSETSEGETRERCILGAASATPVGAGLMPQVEAVPVPNAEAMDWWDYWMDGAAARKKKKNGMGDQIKSD